MGQLAAELAGWPGARVGQDDIWWKPPGTKAVSFHQDAPYFDFLNPVRVPLLWLATRLRSSPRCPCMHTTLAQGSVDLLDRLGRHLAHSWHA